MSKIFFLVDSIGLNRGGLTKTIYDRIKMFVENGHKVELVSCSLDMNCLATFKDIVNAQGFSGVDYTNIYFALNDFEVLDYLDDELESDFLKKYSCAEEVFGETRHLRYFDNGKFVYLKCFKNNTLEYIDKHDSELPHILVRRDYYNSKEVLCESIYFTDNKPRFKQYFYENKKCFLSHWILDGKNYRFVFHEGMNSFTFKSLNDLKLFLIRRYFLECASGGVVILDEPMVIDYINCIPDSFKKIAVIHANHNIYDKDFNEIGLKSWTKKYIDNILLIDRIVFITEEAKHDFLKKFSILEKKVISIFHPIHADVSKLSVTPLVNKTKRIITISRLASGKPVQEAIFAFSKIHDKFPEIKYDIYGIGPNFEEINLLIEKLGLTKKVFLRGYTSNALAEFNDALFSVSLTNAEGFGLSILESLSIGCPVITSDISFGPRDIVIDGESGFLITPHDIENIAEKMEVLLENKDSILDKFSFKAIASTHPKFAYGNWEQAWLGLLSP